MHFLAFGEKLDWKYLDVHISSKINVCVVVVTPILDAEEFRKFRKFVMFASSFRVVPPHNSRQLRHCCISVSEI
jgi:hypothetical protein